MGKEQKGDAKHPEATFIKCADQCGRHDLIIFGCELKHVGITDWNFNMQQSLNEKPDSFSN
jgi:hypothetical protein